MLVSVAHHLLKVVQYAHPIPTRRQDAIVSLQEHSSIGKYERDLISRY